MKDKKWLKDILIYLGLAVIVSGNVLNQPLGNLDEAWVYNFARCISEGLLPYKDISMIITPLFPMICAGFLKIFGNELLTMRILECFETAAILFMIYKIMQRLKINEGIALCLTLRAVSYIFRNILPRL